MHGTSRSGLQESTITCYNGKRCVRLHFSPSIFRRKCAHVFWSARRYIDMGISVFRQVTYKMRERWANKLLTIRLTETMFNKRFFFSFLAVPLTLIMCEHKWENENVPIIYQKRPTFPRWKWNEVNEQKAHTKRNYTNSKRPVRLNWWFCCNSFYFRSDKN